MIENELNNPYNEKKKLKEILEELGMINPNSIIDERSAQLIQEYLYYKSSPHQAPYDSEIWFQTVLTLNPLFETRLF